MHFGSDSSALMWPYDQIAKSIKQDVSDEVRQKQALEILDQMKAADKASAKQREKSAKVLTKLEAVRETPFAAIEYAGQPLVADDRATSERLLDLRFQLKSVLTASEWSKLFPVQATAAEAKKSL